MRRVDDTQVFGDIKCESRVVADVAQHRKAQVAEAGSGRECEGGDDRCRSEGGVVGVGGDDGGVVVAFGDIGVPCGGKPQYGVGESKARAVGAEVYAAGNADAAERGVCRRADADKELRRTSERVVDVESDGDFRRGRRRRRVSESHGGDSAHIIVVGIARNQSHEGISGIRMQRAEGVACVSQHAVVVGEAVARILVGVWLLAAACQKRARKFVGIGEVGSQLPPSYLRHRYRLLRLRLASCHFKNAVKVVLFKQRALHENIVVCRHLQFVAQVHGQAAGYRADFGAASVVGDDADGEGFGAVDGADVESRLARRAAAHRDLRAEVAGDGDGAHGIAGCDYGEQALA